MTQQTGIVRDHRYLLHDPGIGHPECPERLSAVYDMLDTSFNKETFVTIFPQKAAKQDILAVHSQTYWELVAGTAEEDYLLSADTPTCSDSFQTALLAAGGLFRAISMVISGDVKNAFALIRPPGHHAEVNRAMGYCLFNNVALGAVYAQRKWGLKRILIVDWDVHHGNGTQHVFEADPNVLFFSVHQFPHFPGTGAFTEVGIGAGEGCTANVPLPGRYGDGEFAALLDALLRPMAEAFRPELVLVSAGFDAHTHDSLGGMHLHASGFSAMTRILMEIAETCCGGRVVLSLEGGYDPQALAASVKAVLLELGGLSRCDTASLINTADRKKVAYAVRRFRYVHRAYWRCFA